MKDMTICETLEAISQLNDNEDIERMLDYIQERATAMSNALKERRWIPVEERLPKEMELVLIQNIYGVMSVAQRLGDSWFNFQGTELNLAIAWQLLPQPYVKEK